MRARVFPVVLGLVGVLLPASLAPEESVSASVENVDGVPSWVVPADETVNSSLTVGDDGTLALTSSTSSLGADGQTLGAESVSSVSSEPQAPGEWPVGNYDLQRTGDAAWQEFISVPLATTWATPTTDKVQMNPAIVQDTAFFGVAGADRRVFSVDVQSGEVNWTLRLPGSVLGSPAVTDQWVFIGATDGVLYQVDRRTGGVGWRFQTGGALVGGPVVHDGVVFIGSLDAKVYAVDAAAGTQLWSAATPERITAGVTLSSNESQVIVLSGANEWVTALSSDDGSQLWQRHLYDWADPNTLGTAASVSAGRIYLTGLDNILHVLTESTGADVGSQPNLGVSAQNTPVVTESGVFVGTNNGQVKAFTREGAAQWSTVLPRNGLVSSPVHAAGMLFASSTDGTVYGLDAADGSVDWGFATGGALFAAPSIASNHLLVGSDDKTLYSLTPGVPANETHTPQGFDHYGLGLQRTQLYEADPVSTTTGNFLSQSLDVALPGRGLPTMFGRTYNSLAADVDGPIGYGWSHSLATRLLPADTSVTVVWGDGSEDVHTTDGIGGYQAPPDVHERLIATGSGYQLTTKADVTHGFDTAGLLTSMNDRSGNTTTLGYDTAGNLASVTDASNRTLTVTSDTTGRITAVTDVLDRTWSYGYDTAGNLIQATNPAGDTWTYGYDGAHQLTSITDPDGQLLITNRYDSAGRVVEQIDDTGATWTYIYNTASTAITDPNGDTTVYEFDTNWRTTALVDPLGSRTEYVYDAASNLVAVVDPLDRIARLAHDERGNITATLNPLGHKTAYAYDIEDSLTDITDLKGRQVTFTYDTVGRLTSATTPEGLTTTTVYRADGLVASVTDPAGASTTFDYTTDGHPAAVTDPLGRTTSFQIDAAGQVTATTDPTGAATAFAYDPAGRITQVANPLGHTTTHTYEGDGQLATVTDGNGHVTTHTHDTRGLLTATTDPLGRNTTYTYDPARQLTGRTDPRGAAIGYVYDAAGRLTTMSLPDEPDVTFTYDAAGQVTQATNGLGTLTSERDAVGRPVTEHASHTGMTLSRDFDVLGRLAGLTVTRDGSTLTTQQATYRYDADGRVTTMSSQPFLYVSETGTTIDGSTGPVVVGTPEVGNRTTNVAYDPAGRLARLEHYNGVASTYQYDAAGQLTALHHLAANRSTSRWDHRYDDAGHRIQATRSYDADAGPVELTYNYGYDSAGRLTEATTTDPQAPPQANATYTYDAVGNRTSLNLLGAVAAVTYTYDAADQLIADTTTAFDHDQAGNLIARRPLNTTTPTATYQWNALGQLAGQTSEAGQDVEYAYDPMGRRASRTTHTPLSTTEHRYLHDGANTILEQLQGVAEQITTGDMTYLGSMLLHSENAAGGQILHPDGTGNTGEVTLATGDLAARYAYSPYGVPGTTIQGDNLTDPIINRHTYSGAWGVREQADGMYDMRNRLYDPELARFISRDPIEAVTGQPYQYANANPITNIDPNGLCAWNPFDGSSSAGCPGGAAASAVGGFLVDQRHAVVDVGVGVAAGVAIGACGVTVVCAVGVGAGAIAGGTLLHQGADRVTGQPTGSFGGYLGSSAITAATSVGCAVTAGAGCGLIALGRGSAIAKATTNLQRVGREFLGVNEIRLVMANTTILGRAMKESLERSSVQSGGSGSAK